MGRIGAEGETRVGGGLADVVDGDDAEGGARHGPVDEVLHGQVEEAQVGRVQDVAAAFGGGEEGVRVEQGEVAVAVAHAPGARLALLLGVIEVAHGEPEGGGEVSGPEGEGA